MPKLWKDAKALIEMRLVGIGRAKLLLSQSAPLCRHFHGSVISLKQGASAFSNPKRYSTTLARRLQSVLSLPLGPQGTYPPPLRKAGCYVEAICWNGVGFSRICPGKWRECPSTVRTVWVFPRWLLADVWLQKRDHKSVSTAIRIWVWRVRWARKSTLLWPNVVSTCDPFLPIRSQLSGADALSTTSLLPPPRP
jgi:hypothetical protein